jgi:hypothetical protein
MLLLAVCRELTPSLDMQLEAFAILVGSKHCTTEARLKMACHYRLSFSN